MRFQAKGRMIFFATSNINKFNEARQVLSKYDVAVGMLRVKTFEIQSDNLEEIAKRGILQAFEKCHLPIIVEDAGLFVDVLNGFPGPYAAYVYRTIGNKGLLKLMAKIEDRTAKFQSVIAYYSSDLKSPICFKGEVIGEIPKEEQKGDHKSGFGFDPVFKPANANRTFAEMNTKRKNRYSHRAQALRKFAEWYKESARWKKEC